MSRLLQPGHFRGKRASVCQVCTAPYSWRGDIDSRKRASPLSILSSSRFGSVVAPIALWNHYGIVRSSSSWCSTMKTTRNFSSDTAPSITPAKEQSRVVSKVRKRQRPHSRPWTTRQRLRRLITHNELMRDRNVFTSFLAFPKRSASPSSDTLKELTAVAKSRWQWVANRVVSVWKEATDGKDVANTPQNSSNRRPEKYEVIMDERWWFWNILLASLPATLIFVYCEFRGQYLAQDYFRQEELRQMRRILGDHITEHDLPPPPPPPWSARVYRAAGDAYRWLSASYDQYRRTLVDPCADMGEESDVASAAPRELTSATSNTMTSASDNVLASGEAAADPDVDKSTLPWWFFMLPQAIHPLIGPPPVNASDHASTTPATIVPTRSEIRVATTTSPDQPSLLRTDSAPTHDQTEPVTVQVLLKRIENLEERINKAIPNVEQTTEPVPVVPQPAHNGVAASYPAERVRQSGVQNRYEDSLLQKWQHQRLESLSVRADSVDQTSSAGSSSAASLENVSSSSRTVDLKSEAVGVHGNNASAAGAFSWMGVWKNFRRSPSQNMDSSAEKKQA
jgi:hypothetical protein